MNKFLLATIPLLFLSLCTSTGCKKGFIDRYGPFYISSDTTIFYEGTSTGRVDKQFDKLILDYPHIVSMTFSSHCPGSINDESLYIAANKVRSLGIKTILTSESVVESGAVDMFISGATREIADGAQIGVHSWSAGSFDGADLPQDDEEHQMYLEFYNTMFEDEAVGEEFYWFTLESASADDIHYMTSEEIDYFNLVTE
jgi:hypothetical protein